MHVAAEFFPTSWNPRCLISENGHTIVIIQVINLCLDVHLVG